MRNIRISYLAWMVAAVLLLGSCSNPEKMKKAADLVKVSCTPTALEAKAGTVKAKISVSFPAKFFNKKAVLEVTPVLTYNGGEILAPTKILQGEDVKDNNQVINFENGGGYEQEVEFPYNDQLRMATLQLRVNILYKGKTIPFDQPYKLADGVSALYTLATPSASPIFYDQTYQRITPEQKSAEILFMINKAVVEKKQLSSEQVKTLEQYIASVKADTLNKSFQGLSIKAYASPDGPVELNDKLSSKRGASTKDAVKKNFKKVKDVVGKTEVTSLGEDWDGFVALVNASNIADKDLILRVVSMYSDPNVRDREIKNLSQGWPDLKKTILPALRKSNLVANVSNIGLSDDQIKAKIQSKDFSNVTADQLVYGAKLSSDLNYKAAAYEGAIQLDSKNYKAINNLGAVYLLQGKVADAAKQFEAAAAINNDAIVKNNLGAVALAQGKIAEAEKLFVQAGDAGEQVKHNLAYIAITKGQYTAAVDYLAGTNSFNQALALLLVGKTENAAKVLEQVSSPKGYYLRAVIAARQGNESAVLSNLKQALSGDASLKKLAATEFEFRAYLQNAAFQSLL
jgi:outer membrane protein OmpA-like peptidoglycan-associated protein